MPTKLLLLLALGLPLMAQTASPCAPAPHCVILTWNANGNPPTVIYRVYKSPQPCPAPGTDLTKTPLPYSALASGFTATTWVDSSGITQGTWSYYVTADVVGGGQESAPSNCAQAVIPVTWQPASVGITVQ